MCLFCEIAKHNIPSNYVYEDDDVVAILDLSQTTKGHTLVIQKVHSNNIFEADKKTAQILINKSQDIGKILMKKLNANGMNILINTNESAGQTIMHTHVHLIPRYDVDDSIDIKFHENKLDLTEVLKEIKGE